MRIHLVAMMMVLTAAVVTGCDSPREVRDTGRAEARGCNHCHGYPPPPSLTEGAVHPVVPAASCSVCHPSTVNDDGYSIVVPAEGPPAHKNGQVDYVPDWQTPSCTGCHGTPPETGRHVFHVREEGVACGTCHRGFAVGDNSPGARAVDATVHMNGQNDVVLSDGTIIPVAEQPDGSWSDSSCLPCHDALGVND